MLIGFLAFSKDLLLYLYKVFHGLSQNKEGHLLKIRIGVLLNHTNLHFYHELFAIAFQELDKHENHRMSMNYINHQYLL